MIIEPKRDVYQQIVRVTLARTDNSTVTMTERMLPEPDAFETFQKMAKELAGREITKRPLDVRLAEPKPVISQKGRGAMTVFACVLIGVAGFSLMAWFNTMTYHNGYRAGYEQGAADIRRAYGAK